MPTSEQGFPGGQLPPFLQAPHEPGRVGVPRPIQPGVGAHPPARRDDVGAFSSHCPTPAPPSQVGRSSFAGGPSATRAPAGCLPVFSAAWPRRTHLRRGCRKHDLVAGGFPGGTRCLLLAGEERPQPTEVPESRIRAFVRKKHISVHSIILMLAHLACAALLLNATC